MNRVSAKVTLVRSSPMAEELIASAAKLCYADETGTILEPDTQGAADFVRMLRKLGHLSPIEHVVFTFYVEGVSRAMTHQLVRHRLASYSQRSQRYVGHADFDYVMPPALEGKTVTVDGEPRPAEDYFRETMELIAGRYAALNAALGEKGEASHQDARYVLPNACETKIFITMNARELLHFFEERLCQRAQWEIRSVAEQMLTIARRQCSAVFECSGPKCIRLGRCPEGRKSCGRFEEMQARYGGK